MAHTKRENEYSGAYYPSEGSIQRLTLGHWTDILIRQLLADWLPGKAPRLRVITPHRGGDSVLGALTPAETLPKLRIPTLAPSALAGGAIPVFPCSMSLKYWPTRLAESNAT